MCCRLASAARSDRYSRLSTPTSRNTDYETGINGDPDASVYSLGKKSVKYSSASCFLDIQISFNAKIVCGAGILTKMPQLRVPAARSLQSSLLAHFHGSPVDTRFIS
jgi:hypothetical protein